MPTLGELIDCGAEQSLRAHGIADDNVDAKTLLFAEAARTILSEGADRETEAKAFFVPGRVEVVGKHTDYAGGRSLLIAISKAFCIVTVDRDDDQCRFMSTAKKGEDLTVKMSADTIPKAGHWTLYPVTTVRRLSSNFAEGGLKGVDMAIACDLPGASGMSSSSAIICGTWLALNARNKFNERDVYKDNIRSNEDLMEYLGCNENGQNFRNLIGDKGVGTFGGSEDHTAIMSCSAGKLNMYSYCPTINEGVFNCPEDMCFVIAVSGAIAEKTGAKMKDYNDASLLAREAAKIYCEAHDIHLEPLHLANVIKHASGNAQAVRDAIVYYFKEGKPAAFAEADLLRRFDQFYWESEEIVAGVAHAIENKDVTKLSKLVDRSQELTDTHLRNQVPETVSLAKTARELGAVAASAFGAGFGGSVWAYIAKTEAPKFMTRWKHKYAELHPEEAGSDDCTFFIDVPGPGAFQLVSRNQPGPTVFNKLD